MLHVGVWHLRLKCCISSVVGPWVFQSWVGHVRNSNERDVWLLDALHTACEGHMSYSPSLLSEVLFAILLQPISEDYLFHYNALFSGETLRCFEYISIQWIALFTLEGKKEEKRERERKKKKELMFCLLQQSTNFIA